MIKYIIAIMLVVGILSVNSTVLYEDTLYQPINYGGYNDNMSSEEHCLATAIYHEARGGSIEGWIAVANVIINRTNAPEFPKTICAVVYQRLKHNVCQFSFSCAKHLTVVELEVKNDIDNLAQSIYHNIDNVKQNNDFTNGALFYHTNKIHPKWKGMVVTAKIDDHIFKKLKTKGV